jgi:hypothetical protein
MAKYPTLEAFGPELMYAGKKSKALVNLFMK